MITSNIQNIPNLHIIITCWHEDGIKAKKMLQLINYLQFYEKISFYPFSLRKESK